MMNMGQLDEAGIDGGGIFREFMEQLMKAGFDCTRGLFENTTDQLLFPRRDVHFYWGDDYEKHYYFLGRMLGKVSQQKYATFMYL